ncbi:MAG: glycosyltransferase family 4 protein [Caldilineaceae bacterium]|nr:glycosyltransferase family 4 protein [Caldilineaceae bacterium]
MGGDPAVRLVIAGRLPETDSAFAPDPPKIAAELRLTDQVQFCGWIDEADKPAFYALATAFLFPSLYEGFGMMVLEAMAAGTPVITSAPH